jgi:signal transduction histidine kinase
VVNAVRHARARRIGISLECVPGQSQVRLVVSDDGVGRGAGAPSRGGLGLRIMAHRAKLIGGTLSVDDAEAGGTVVACVAPCGRQKSQE